MKGVRQSGYTVVEISLFLGISGLLFLVAVFGTGTVVGNLRFTDSGRSLVAYIQKQYDDVFNGVNPRDGQEACNAGTVGAGVQTPGTSNCLLLGKLIVLRQDSANLEIYHVVGTEPASPNYSLTDELLIPTFLPRVVANFGVASYEIPWQSYISGSKRLSDNQAASALLLLRSPRSTRILSYTYKAPATITQNLIDQSGINVVTNTANVGRETNFCIQRADDTGPPAKLVIRPTGNQTAASIVFDGVSGDCNGT